MSGVVIIGAGHGGAQAAASLRQGGYDGQVTLIDESPALPYHKPPLSKSYLKNPDEAPQPLFAEKFYTDQRIECLRATRVAAIEPASSRVTLSTGTAIHYTHLVLATGARNRQLALPSSGLTNIFSLRTAADALALRNALAGATAIVIIGGGFIGLEAAVTFAALGHSVTVLEAAPRLLARAVSPVVSAHIEAGHRARGIRVITNTSITSFAAAAGRVRAVRTTAGESLPADLVLVGIGAVANDDLAKDAGLACDNGIVVSASLRAAANIFAIGDCASYPHFQAGRMVRLESVQNAADHARHAAKSILGQRGDYAEVPWFWSDQGGTRLQLVGLAFEADRHVTAGETSSDSFSVYRLKGDRLLAVESVNRTLDHMLARKLLAAGISPSAEDILAGPERLKAIITAGAS